MAVLTLKKADLSISETRFPYATGSMCVHGFTLAETFFITGNNLLMDTQSQVATPSLKSDEKQKKYNKAPVCTHCGKKHPSKKEDECWEPAKNKSSRPEN
jgi:hypothetical protein